MIQRIQSVWLFLAAVAAALTLKYPFYVGAWLRVGGMQQPQTELSGYYPSTLILIVTVVVIVLSLIALIMFKNRKQQMLLAVLGLLISLALIYFYYNEIKTHFAGGTVALTSILTFLIPILLFFAIRGIYRDMKLVKSVDRLR